MLHCGEGCLLLVARTTGTEKKALGRRLDPAEHSSVSVAGCNQENKPQRLN